MAVLFVYSFAENSTKNKVGEVHSVMAKVTSLGLSDFHCNNIHK